MTDQATVPALSVPNLVQNLERAYAQKLVAILLGAALVKLGLQVNSGTNTILLNIGVTILLGAISFAWTHIQELKATKTLEAALNSVQASPPVSLT